MLDFIFNAPPFIKVMIFVLSLNIIWCGVVLWNETKKFKQLMKELKAQPERWSKFKETGDDYHFLKKGDQDANN